MSETRAKLSSGTLLYRYVDGAVEVLFLDWMGNVRCTARLAREAGGPLALQRLEAGEA